MKLAPGLRSRKTLAEEFMSDGSISENEKKIDYFWFIFDPKFWPKLKA